MRYVRYYELMIITVLSSFYKEVISEKENFQMYDLARVRNELEDEGFTTTEAPRYNLVWKITQTTPSTTTERIYPGGKDHGLIIDALIRTMMDGEYRYMWLSLMKEDYDNFLRELEVFGHKRFIKESPRRDDTFEGKHGLCFETENYKMLCSLNF